MIPWAKPDFWGNEINYVNEALESSWISGGPYIELLEEQFRSVLNAKHVLAVSNGTTALHLAYLALDINPGDEIIIPGFCFLAAANIALHMGAKPVFCEVDANTWCMDPAHLESKITKRTKAIVPVHTYGNVCDMGAIMQVADKHGIPVIEDCAESLFSRYDNRESGTFGLISTFSFQATKMITTGEGGLVATNDDLIARKMALYRSHGMDRNKIVYWHELPGHNFRLTNMQAALGVAQMEQINKIIAAKQRVYNAYRRHLQNVEGLVLQKITQNVDPVVWAVAMRLDTNVYKQGRDTLIRQLKDIGIETRPGFYASSLLPIYEAHPLPVCEDISKTIISLPSFATLTDEQILFICSELIKLKS